MVLKARGLDEVGEMSLGRGGQQSKLSPGTFLLGGGRDEAEPSRSRAGAARRWEEPRENAQPQVLQQVRVENRPMCGLLRTLTRAVLWREGKPNWSG